MKTAAFVGLAVRALHLQPGQKASYKELADWIEAGGEKISWQRCQQIEQRALRKIRIHITRELNNDAKEVLFDGLRLLSQTKVNLWDQQTRRLQ